MPLLTNNKATSITPQAVMMILDDSNSMSGPAQDGQSKATVATEAIRDMIMATQAGQQGSKGFRYLMSLACFGNTVTPIAVAASPDDIDLRNIQFRGTSGWTNMSLALEWGVTALEQSLAKCRALPKFVESSAPPPLVIFVSDGNNTGGSIDEVAKRLKSIPFASGGVNVIACGIAMEPEHFATMQAIASSDDLALNIKPSQLAEFIAAVGATMRRPDQNHLGGFHQRWWEGFGAAPTPVPPPPPPRPPVIPEPPTPPPPRPPTPSPPKPHPDPEDEYKREETETSDVGLPMPPTPTPTPLPPDPKPSPEPVQNEWDSQMAVGRAALAEGRYAQAEPALLRALNEVRNRGDNRLASSMSYLGMLHAAQGDWVKTQPFVTGALDLLSTLGPSTALREAIEAAQKLAELLVIADKQPEADSLWRRIAKMGGLAAPNTNSPAHEWATFGFILKLDRRVPEAAKAFEEAVKKGGVGAAAALRGLYVIKKDDEGWRKAVPRLEQLEVEVASRFGTAHPFAKKVMAELHLAYSLANQNDKIAQLKQKYSK